MPSKYLLEQPIPIGVFWDMENCTVPLKCSASEFVTNVRDKFYDGHFEADFVGVCDIRTQRKSVLIELTYAQVTTVHVCNTCKNAADDKLRLLIRRFANLYPSPATIILITSDINFSPELSDLRYKHNYRTILIHGRLTSHSLLCIPNESFYFDGFFTSIDVLTSLNREQNENILFVRNLPFFNNSTLKLKSVLERLFSTTKGRILSVAENMAIITFPNFEAALRAKARYSNQVIWGKRIDISIPNGVLLHRIIPTNCNASKHSLGVRSKADCETPNGVVNGSHDMTLDGKVDDTNVCDESGVCNDDIQVTRDGSGKSWKSSDRRCTDKSTTSSSQSSENKLRFDQSFRYSDCNAKSDDFKVSGTDNLFACNGKHAVRNILKEDLSKIVESNHNTSPGKQNGRNTLVNRKLFSDNNDVLSWGRVGASQRYSTPKGYYEAGFRRTPGAHRPSNPCHQNGGHYNKDLRPQFLFTSNAEASLVENGSIGKKSSRSHSAFSEKLPVPYEHHKGWHDADDKDVSGVDLIISNLDYNISKNEWKKILTSEFHNVQMRSLTVQMQANNTSIATVKVANMEDAEYVISQFHRKKIGYKRIHVTLVSRVNKPSELEILRSNIINILKSTPGHKLPLIQFFEHFEKRHHKKLTILDLQELSDCIEVVEQEGLGKLVLLCSQESAERVGDVFVCQNFCAKHVEASFWEGFDLDKNPKVKLLLRGFSTHVHKLLQSHEGGLPLGSFPACYAREFSSLKLMLDEDGVSLEHLVTCVPGVEIVTLPFGVKRLQWSENHSPPQAGANSSGYGSPILSEQLNHLNHEVCELLKNTPKCCIEVSKFSTLYQQYFGRQCRSSDFGCNSLDDLLKSLSQCIQIIGSGSSSCITLIHQLQVSRFSSDLLKILKVQGQNPLNIIDLPLLYNNVIGKPFDITEFGVCYIEDMLSEVSSSSFVVAKIDSSIFLSLIKIEHSVEEVKLINKYREDVVALLRTCPNYCIPCDQFLSAYYQQHKARFKLVDCGFTHLSDFFESISESIKITQYFMEKYLCLSEKELVKLMKEQFLQIFVASDQKSLSSSELTDLYLKTFGHPWKLKDYGVNSFSELVAEMAPEIMLEGPDEVAFKVPEIIEETSSNVLLVVMDFSNGCMSLEDLQRLYQSHFNEDLTECFLVEHMKDFVTLQKSSSVKCLQVKLLAAQMFARDVRLLLLNHQQQQIPLLEFEQHYQKFFKISFKPDLYNHQSLASLFKSASRVISCDGCLSNWNVCLQPKFKTCLYGRVCMKFNESQTPVDQQWNLNRVCSEEGMLNVELDGIVEASACSTSNLFPFGISSPKLELHRNQEPATSDKSLQGFLVTTKEEKKDLKIPHSQTPISDLLAFAAKLLPRDVYKNSCLEKRIESSNNDQPNALNPDQLLPRSRTLDLCLLGDQKTPIATERACPGRQHHGLSDPVPRHYAVNENSGFETDFSLERNGCEACKPSNGNISPGCDEKDAQNNSEVLDVSRSIDEDQLIASNNSTSTSEKSSTTHLRRSRIVAKFNLTS